MISVIVRDKLPTIEATNIELQDSSIIKHEVTLLMI